MMTLPEPLTGKMAVLVNPEQEMVTQLTAWLVHAGEARLIDGGNRFAAYDLARHLRRQTPHLEAALSRLIIARAFTCYQMVSLLAQTPATAVPLLVSDLLVTFDDDNVSPTESTRLLRLALRHLHRLRQAAPVVIIVRPPHQPARACLLHAVQAAADVVWQREPAVIIPPPTLF